MSPRRACKKDANHDLIAEAFRKAGCMVIETYQVAQVIPGYPDLDVRWGEVSVLIEVKTADGELTDDERAFYEKCAGWDVPYYIVRDVEQVVPLASWMKREGA